MAITAKAKQMKAEGIDIVGFSAGEPDFDTPDFIKNAAKKALDEGKTKYTDVYGMPELRDALTDYFKRTENLEYERAETIFSLGGKHCLYNIMQALISDGDEVIIPTPYWVSYPDMVLLAGGKPVFLETSETKNFMFNVDELRSLVTDKTKAIVINSPSNPSGMVYDEDNLKAIADVAIENGIYIIWDEIYKDVYYGEGKLRSLPVYDSRLKDLTLIVSGLSKNFSMTGWRIGYTLGPAKIIKAMGTIQGQSTSNPTTFAQYGALAALREGPTHIGEWLKAFKERRDRLLLAFDSIEGITSLTPEGAFYVFPNISGWYGKKWDGGVITDSYDATQFLLESARCAVVPGDPFGAPDNIRISYATSMENIEKGIERIATAVKTLR